MSLAGANSMFFKKIKFSLLKSTYFHFAISAKKVLVIFFFFFKTKQRKSLMWQKCQTSTFMIFYHRCFAWFICLVLNTYPKGITLDTVFRPSENETLSPDTLMNFFE